MKSVVVLADHAVAYTMQVRELDGVIHHVPQDTVAARHLERGRKALVAMVVEAVKQTPHSCAHEMRPDERALVYNLLTESHYVTLARCFAPQR